ncbi:cyclic pyranopterin monophosphate synthase MoaC [Sphingosinicella sp. GR2756]|uniref:Cyclic pyranopterin monophosphate synthase n=2 Tax=Sphingosinicella rhizophila TaxID=3050082 RepID=A0ABU3Q5U9_9SPHN|nr:cyclic pyranopterin monophosphate synthase MoaC [Sphingosinicella sp. GR2756]MDT9598784.1 cyclic pyranopterin monophosphate synthase MoaC [Sphingosinicella sp. GR2756]
MSLTHIDEGGRARMVDVGDKPDTDRRATAEGMLLCAPETLAMVREDRAPKGAVLTTAELAGIMAAKRTADLIPLCHPLPLAKVVVLILPDEALPGFRVQADVRTRGATGVEMEALTAVSVACLTLFDMLKAVDRTMVIDGIRVRSKSGGRSGDWQSQ